jgi:hypothetical protein
MQEKMISRAGENVPYAKLATRQVMGRRVVFTDS